MVAPDCCDALTWARIVAPLAAVLVSVVTWALTRQSTVRSEHRKEMKEKIDKLNGQVDTIHKLSHQYHTAEVEDRSLASELHVLLKILAADLGRIDFVDTVKMSELVMGLRRSITLRNFETSEFSPKRRSDPLLKGIDEACGQIKTLLDSACRLPRGHWPWK